MGRAFKIVEKNFSIVMLGQFNVLHHIPENLHSMGLLNSEDLAASKVELVTPTDVLVSLPWGHLRVEPIGASTNRLSIFLNDYDAKTLFKDFVFSILQYNDTAQPYGLGINHTIWTEHADRGSWDSFGHKLVPHKPWLELFSGSRAGMNNLSIKIESILEPAFELLEKSTKPELNIGIKPVKRLASGRAIEFGTECSFNYHFPLDTDAAISNALATLDKYLDQIFESGDQTLTNLVEKFS